MEADVFNAAESLNKRTLALTYMMDNAGFISLELPKRIGLFNVLRDILHRYCIKDKEDADYVESQLNQLKDVMIEDVIMNLKMEVDKLNQQFASL